MSAFEFTANELTVLRDLTGRPEWPEIERKLRAGRTVPAFRPGKSATEEQIARWKYDSGVVHGVESVLKRLSDG